MKEFRIVQSVKGMKNGLHPLGEFNRGILIGIHVSVKKNLFIASI
jgi:hypothetical protein